MSYKYIIDNLACHELGPWITTAVPRLRLPSRDCDCDLGFGIAPHALMTDCLVAAFRNGRQRGGDPEELTMKCWRN